MNEKNQHSTRNTIFGIVTTITGFAFGWFLGFLIFIFFAAMFIGLWLGKWYSWNHRENKAISIIAWSNVVSWLLPPAGILTASATYVFSKNIDKKNKSKYTGLWMIGAILALGNAALVLHSLNFAT